MVKVTRHMKMPLRLSKTSWEGLCKANGSFGHSLVSVLWACCHNSQLCVLTAVKPSASKGVTKAMVLTTTGCTARCFQETCKRSDIQVPGKGRTEEEQPSLSRDMWDNLVLRTSNTSLFHVFVWWPVPGIPQSWPQHRWHRCSWKLCSFPVAPSRVQLLAPWNLGESFIWGTVRVLMAWGFLISTWFH